MTFANPDAREIDQRPEPQIFAPRRLRPTAYRDLQWRIRMALGPDVDATNFDTYDDVSVDVIDSYGVHWDRGNTSSGPNDRLAETGHLTFTLNNSARNYARRLGHYSPAHRTARRSGWDIGVPVLLEIAYQGEWTVEWVGRVDEIDVEGGFLDGRTVSVSCKDWMEEAAQHKIRGLSILDGVRADEVIAAIIAANAIQPPGGTILDTGSDVYPLAFDDIRDGDTTAVTEIAKALRSGLDYGFVTRGGAFRYQNRYARIGSNENLFVLDGTMQGVRTKRSRGDIVNHIDVTVHPRSVDAFFSVLWSSDSHDLVAAGESIEYRADFIDPTSHERVGAIDVQDLVANLDYSMSTAPTSSGSPDTPFTATPVAVGHYSEISGSIADLADNDNTTGLTPTAAFQYTTVIFTEIATPPAAPNATITGVKFVVEVRHNSSNSHVNWHVRIRLNDIDFDDFGDSTGEGASAGLYTFTKLLPKAPGNVDWTVAAFNAAEFGSAFNWSSAAPTWVKASVVLVYSSQVDDNDRTADFTVTLPTVSGSSAVIRFVNNGTEGAYVTHAQIRGRAIRQLENKTTSVVDQPSIDQFGETGASVDMSLQSSVSAGADACAYLLSLYSRAIDRPGAVQFLGNLSAEHMRAALRLEIGDRVGLRETVTGLSASDGDGNPVGYHIVGMSGELQPGPILVRTWQLAPADPLLYFRVDIEGQDEVDGDAVVGPL